MPFDVLTLDETAKLARMSRRALTRRISEGTGPAVMRMGRRVRVRSDALEAWFDSMTVRPVAGRPVSAGNVV